MSKKKAKNVDALLAQREASVRFGRMALQSGDIDVVLTEACRLIAEALSTDLAKIMELQEDGRTLLVVAGVGWKEGVVGEERIPALESSSEGFALNTGRPAVSTDINGEDRFDYAEFLVQHGVRAMINVIIPGAEGRPPYGLLQADSTNLREFSEGDIEFMQGYANLVGAAIERHYYHRKLEEALKTQERLFAELQHRVRNNLAVILSLLRLKAGRAAHPVTKREISEVIQQVNILNELHNQLHASSKVDEVDLGGYIAAICNNVASFQGQLGEVRVENDHVSVLVGPDLAVNLGLVVNEFVTNSVKYARGDTLTISTSIRREGDKVRLRIADNGPGLGDALQRKGDTETGSGLGLIEAILEHAGCVWEWRTEPSAEVCIDVPLATKLVHRKS